ncbi:Glycerol-3-phosphate transporter N-terminal domain protein [Candidatus Hepatincolaceae symbiont of Richtersius coronifer]
MFNFLKSAKAIPQLKKEKIDLTYKRLRLQVFIGIFVGYIPYYLLRKNFGLSIPALQKLDYSKGEIELVFSSLYFTYGFSKFLMGNASDRSNPRYFYP